MEKVVGIDNLAWESDEPGVTFQKNVPVGHTLSSPAVMEHRKNSENSSNSEIGVKETIEDFDDVLPHIGEFGTYQIILFFLTAPFCFFLAFSYFSQVFITLTPDHYCLVRELQESNLTMEQIQHLSIPMTKNVLGGGEMRSTCTMYDVNYTQLLEQGILEPDPSWKQVPCRNGWNYDLSHGFPGTNYNTIVSEYNWVCEDAGNSPLAQALFFCGSILGGILMGYMADHFGRIPALISCNLIGAIAGIITAFSRNFAVFAFSRFLMGVAFDNCFTMMYILVLEYVGPKYRTLVANLSLAIFYAGGTVVIPWIAWAVSDWRVFSLATSIPMLVAVLSYWIVPESARWLLSRGQVDKAIEILHRFQRINKTHVEKHVYQQLKESSEEAYKEASKAKTRSVLDLLKTPRLRRNTILVTLLWVLVAVVYDGHARNTANLGLSVFVTFSVASATELPADLLLVFFLDRWGRRAFAFGSLFLAAIFSLVTLAVPAEQAVVSAVLAIIGRFCVNITFNIGLQYGAELIPTEVRAQGIAAVHIAGYVAAIISPYIVDLARFSPVLPLIVLGILALAGAIVGLMLPETLGAILPETIEDGENFAKDQGFWDFPFCSKKPDSDVTEPQQAEVPVPFEKKNFSRSSLRTSIRGEALRSSLLVKRASIYPSPNQLKRAGTTRN